MTAAAVLALAACGSSSSDGPGYASETAVPADYGTAVPESASKPALRIYDGSLGPFLVDGENRPVYLFEKDAEDQSACSGACASAWPPVPASEASEVGDGVKADLLGRIDRTDGTTQLTYAGHPLYRFAGDAEAGVPTGEGSNGFGAPWHVVQPSGAALEQTVPR